jgi:formylglycine-generating enzyme required for sulfatase activity
MNENLKIILQKEKLENLLPLFTSQNITDSCLTDLGDDCLVELGVEKIGDRMRLLAAFRDVSEQLASGGSFMLMIVGGTLPHDSLLAGQNVDSFMMGKYPILLPEWQRVKVWGGAKGYELKSGEAEGGMAPIVNVSWYDALKFCNAKSEKLGLTPCYSIGGKIYRSDALRGDRADEVSWDKKANGYRLPMEAEWEWAARSGVCKMEEVFSNRQQVNAAMGLLNHFPNNAVPINGNSKVELLESYELPNNLWEWCWDLAEEEFRSHRRIRGGCWNFTLSGGLEKLRMSRSPDSLNDVVGFRIARNCEQ